MRIQSSRKIKIYYRFPRNGLTLVELLIVIAIISLLMQLVLPAIQSAREAARRNQCANNLRQFGIATENFYSANQAFPRNRLRCHHGTWAIELLPYLEENALADRWDKVQSFFGQPVEVIQTNVPAYFCPSRRAPPQLSRAGQDDFSGPGGTATNREGALGDYAGCVGDGNINGVSNDMFKYGANGVIVSKAFLLSSCGGENPFLLSDKGKNDEFYVTYALITDGSSHTLMFGEKNVSLLGQGYLRSPELKKGIFDNSIYNPDQMRTVGRYAGYNYPLRGGGDEPDFGGPHAGICQFVFADGSVHAISLGIDQVTLGLLANRNDGETIDQKLRPVK